MITKQELSAWLATLPDDALVTLEEAQALLDEVVAVVEEGLDDA